MSWCDKIYQKYSNNNSFNLYSYNNFCELNITMNTSSTVTKFGTFNLSTFYLL